MGLFDFNASSEKNELDRGVSKTKGDRFDTNLDDDPAGIARKRLAQESKERYAREAAALASQNRSYFSTVMSTDAKEDDDIMDEEAGRMRLVLAAEARARRGTEQAELNHKNTLMKLRLANTPAAYMTNSGSATGIYSMINRREDELKPACQKPPSYYNPHLPGR